MIKNGKLLRIIYVPREEIAPAFGEAWCKINLAYVRQDLPKIVQRFVRAHEMYHLIDPYKWGGRLGQEIRANLAGTIECPLGFLWSLFLTLTSRQRLRFYADRIKKKY